jgi:hypothetical protein
MRTTVDIPDPLYRQLKRKAASEGRSVNELILRGIKTGLQGGSRGRHQYVSLPLIPSGSPGTGSLDNARIFELIPFP